MSFVPQPCLLQPQNLFLEHYRADDVTIHSPLDLVPMPRRGNALRCILNLENYKAFS